MCILLCFESITMFINSAQFYKTVILCEGAFR